VCAEEAECRVSTQAAQVACVDKMETKEGRESVTMLSKCNIAQLPADVTLTLQTAFKLLCVSALMCNVDLDSISASERPGDEAFVVKYRQFILFRQFNELCREVYTVTEPCALHGICTSVSSMHCSQRTVSGMRTPGGITTCRSQGPVPRGVEVVDVLHVTH
jgi:hypothetical protein